MAEFFVILLAVGAWVFVGGMLGEQLRARLWLPDALVVLILGVMLGPHGACVLLPEMWPMPYALLEELARAAVALGLMELALRLPAAWPLRHWRAQAVNFLLVLPVMWAVASVLVFGILGLPWPMALLLGAILTPIDPIVSRSLITGRLAERALPGRIRQTIAGEAGTSDALTYPFLMVGIMLLHADGLDGWLIWLSRVVVWGVLVAGAFGILLGLVAGYLLRWIESNDWADEPSLLPYSAALALLTVAVTKLIGTDGVVAVFVAGMTFGIITRDQPRHPTEPTPQAIGKFLEVAVFFLLGAMVPLDRWATLQVPPVVLFGLILALLIFRRLPIIWFTRRLNAALVFRSDARVVGWIAPSGLLAVLYCLMASRKIGDDLPWVVGSLLIVASLLIHGMTAPPVIHRYAEIHPIRRTRPPSASSASRV